ncbi:hypothetical protein FKN01_16185 [Streptomyces sp. 130]|uniref:2OG-Fe dioxygenase family protein n=1 Tax=Streptomyces sp. 130 TaxID=2591006 RepID=UPI00117BE3E8|nr:2OG-Fe dioxygenase family protein [Streptomyces sp. 130]TRV77282.1 hypothetical protein FKN01_16185 [Streptomyces sp. 130]
MNTLDISRTLSELEKIKGEYVRNRMVFIDGARVVELLKGLGATDADLEQLKSVSDHLGVDPTLPFRESKNCRFVYDGEQRRIERGEFQPFVLSAEEDFVRHDSGQIRKFDEVENDLQLNTAFQQLLRINEFMARGVDIEQRPGMDYDSPHWVCTLFHLRTVTTPELVGEPALEGVHSDGVDHTMTTLLGTRNMTEDSAVTYLHDMRQENAVAWDKADPDLVVGSCQHRHFLDTMLVVDHERKHSLSPVRALDPQQRSTRDMLVFFTRKPAMEGHVSYPYDSLGRHVGLPMSVDYLDHEAGSRHD